MPNAGLKKVLLDAALVALIGATLSLAANALSPRGIKLAKNYFPPPPKSPSQAESSLPFATRSSETNSEWEKLAGRLNSEGLQLITGKQALKLYNDPGHEQDQIVFIDARPHEEEYRTGHIPGAYEFDRYHPENYIAMVIPACEHAQKIVVYCNGGHCEDSEFAARSLKDDFHIPGEKLLVYGGGITEWATNKWPIETGERRSGNLKNGNTTGK